MDLGATGIRILLDLAQAPWGKRSRSSCTRNLLACTGAPLFRPDADEIQVSGSHLLGRHPRTYQLVLWKSARSIDF